MADARASCPYDLESIEWRGGMRSPMAQLSAQVETVKPRRHHQILVPH